MANTAIDMTTLPGYVDGSGVYFVVRDRAGQIWDTGGVAFEALDQDQWDANYAVDMNRTAEQSGHYVGTFPSGIDPGRYYVDIHVQLAGAKNQRDDRLDNRVIDWDGDEILDLTIFHADINWIQDALNSQDECTVRWFRNGAQVTAGITTPLIQIINAEDGTDRLAETAMSPGESGSSGIFQHTVSGATRIASGEPIEVVVTATIEGAARTFSRVFSIR